MPASIQDVLYAAGYRENPTKEQFERGGDVIPYSELIGYTVDSFREKAKRKGWLREEPVTGQRKLPPYLWPA